MIVLIDPSNKTVTICDKKVHVYHWSQLDLIASIIKGKKLIYVVESMETDGDEVMDLISSSLTEEDIGEHPFVNDDRLYFHTTVKEKVLVNYNGKEFIFKGKGDIRAVESLPDGFFEKCIYVVDGIKNGTFEIITDDERLNIINELEKEKMSKKGRGSILVDSSISAADVAEGKNAKNDIGAITIDLASGKSFKK